MTIGIVIWLEMTLLFLFPPHPSPLTQNICIINAGATDYVYE